MEGRIEFRSSPDRNLVVGPVPEFIHQEHVMNKDHVTGRSLCGDALPWAGERSSGRGGAPHIGFAPPPRAGWQDGSLSRLMQRATPNDRIAMAADPASSRSRVRPGSTIRLARRRANAAARAAPPVFRELGLPLLGAAHLRMGVDVVEIRRVRESLDCFGARFTLRLFTEDEISYAMNAEGQEAPRLAARFAAKEATIKALDLGETGINWRDIEVQKLPGGACSLALHGRVAAQARQLGVCEIALSLSHDGDYAAAVVTALVAPASADSTHYRGTAP